MTNGCGVDEQGKSFLEMQSTPREDDVNIVDMQIV